MSGNRIKIEGVVFGNIHTSVDQWVDTFDHVNRSSIRNITIDGKSAKQIFWEQKGLTPWSSIYYVDKGKGLQLHAYTDSHRYDQQFLEIAQSFRFN